MTKTERTPDRKPYTGDEQNLGWSGGTPAGASDAGQGLAPEAHVEAGEDSPQHAMGRASQGRDDASNMDTSGLVESYVTRPSTLTPEERKVRPHNTERANRVNERDATARLSEDDSAEA